MIELLHDLRIKLLNFFERASHAFFETTVGQKVLILLAPFFLLPGERIEERQAFLNLFKFLHMQAWGPVLGGVFFSGALTVLLRILQRAHLPLIGYIDVEALNVLVLLTLLSVLLGYILALTQFITPHCINYFIKDDKLITEPFFFWTTRYGGFLMFFGVIAWLMAGLVALKPSFFTILILLGGAGTLGYVVRKEISQQQQKFIAMISPGLRLTFLIIKGILFVAFSLLATLSVHYIYSF
jgi:fumarate reductase subunit C